MSRRQTYQKQIVDFLADGDWHEFETIYRAVRQYVPPEAAEAEYKKRHPQWKADQPKTRVEKGKRRLVILTLISLKYRGQVEGYGEPGEQMFKIVAKKKAKAAKPKPKKAKAA